MQTILSADPDEVLALTAPNPSEAKTNRRSSDGSAMRRPSLWYWIS